MGIECSNMLYDDKCLDDSIIENENNNKEYITKNSQEIDELKKIINRQNNYIKTLEKKIDNFKNEYDNNILELNKIKNI